MLGAIIGDIIGSVYEHAPIKKENFLLFSLQSRFTDDTVLTIAVADSILNKKTYKECILHWGRRYPYAGYGAKFYQWLLSEDPQPYQSWGNGAAMRVSPVGFAFQTLEEVIAEAKKSAEISHDHPEGIKGAQAVAAAIWLARHENTKIHIKDFLESTFNYHLSKPFEEIQKDYCFDVSAQGSVPQAIIAFLASNSMEDAIRKAVSLGGDSDTQACIAGAIGQAFYKDIPPSIIREVVYFLSKDMRRVINQFNEKYHIAL
ncbi:ADP-ribosylglycohydrolase family protein [soil metagenome]